MLFERINDDPQLRFKVVTCKYCGSQFIKLQNASKYCSDKCRYNSTLEHTEERVRRFRKKFKNQTDDYWGLGSGYLHGTPKDDFDSEHKAILNEYRRLKLSVN